MESPHDILSIDTEADAETVKRAYKQRVKEAHPDHGGSIREFQRVRSAYEDLRAGETGNGDRIYPDGVPDPPGRGDEGVSAPYSPSPADVEYLNYAVLDDFGWSLDDEDLFEKAANAGLGKADYGQITVPPHESLLGAAQECGYAWPYACRGGACANCAVAVTDGDLTLPVNHILPEEMTERGIRLSCVGAPSTDELQVVFNVKHLPDLDDLRLPPYPFKNARATE